MSTANGRADLVGSPLQLGDFLPERRTVTINGRDYTAWLLRDGEGLPRRLRARLDRARLRYSFAVDAALDTSDDATLTPDEIALKRLARQEALINGDVAYQTYITEALMVLIEGLDEDTADMIPSAKADEVLIELGYFPPKEQRASQQMKEAETEATIPLTGATSPPVSRTSIRATRRSSS